MCSQPLPSNLVHFRHLAYEKWVYRIWRGFSNQMKLEKKPNVWQKRDTKWVCAMRLTCSFTFLCCLQINQYFFFFKTKKRKSFFLLFRGRDTRRKWVTCFNVSTKTLAMLGCCENTILVLFEVRNSGKWMQPFTNANYSIWTLFHLLAPSNGLSRKIEDLFHRCWILSSIPSYQNKIQVCLRYKTQKSWHQHDIVEHWNRLALMVRHINEIKTYARDMFVLSILEAIYSA